MKSILSRIIAFGVLISSISPSYANVLTSQLSVLNIVEEYEYQLENTDKLTDLEKESLKKEIKSKLVGRSRNELESAITEIASDIPDENSRSILLKKIKFASESELNDMLLNPELITSSLRGEGANFSFGNEGIGVNIGAVVLIAFLIYAVYMEIKYDNWYSYTVEYGASSGSECKVSNFASADYSEASMKESAKQRCLEGAKNPDTCKAKGLVAEKSYDYDYYGDIIGGSCDLKYRYQSEN